MNKITETMLDMGKGELQGDGLYFYNFEKLCRFAPDIPLWMITGMRRIGKTHLATALMFELWHRFGWTSALIRNNKVEFKEQFTNSFLNAPLRFGWCTEEWTCSDEGVCDPEGNRVISFIALSTYSNYRGNEHPDLHLLFVDEMQREDGRSVPNPHIAISSLIKTLLSGKPDCMCIMASNRISATNNFFLGFKIYPDPRKAVTVFHDKGIAIECCRKGDYHEVIEPSDPFQAVFKAANYGDYADDSNDDMMTLVRPLPKGAKPTGAIFLIDGTRYRAMAKDGIFYFTEWKVPPKNGDWICTPNIREMTDSVEGVWPFQLKELKDLMTQNVLRYTSANVMMAIISMIVKIDV